MGDTDFRQFVGPRLEPLRRTAYLMCGDWHMADEVVASALIKLCRDWRRISWMHDLDAYVRRAVIDSWLDERSRPGRLQRSASAPVLPADDRSAIVRHLDALPAGQRAVAVLRLHCDLSVADTAYVLECSPGAVTGHTERALASLRTSMCQAADVTATGLTEQLNAAVDAPPPPRFELDQLIRLGRLQGARARALSMIPAIAVVALAAIGAYSINAAWRADALSRPAEATVQLAISPVSLYVPAGGTSAVC